MEEEKDFLELIKETREDFREAREKFHELLPPLVRVLLEYCVENAPEEQFRELVQKTRLGIAEIREGTTKIWEEDLERLFSMIRKRFQPPIKPKEIKEQVLALMDLLKEAAHLIIEELEAVDMMEAELDKVTKK